MFCNHRMMRPGVSQAKKLKYLIILGASIEVGFASASGIADMITKTKTATGVDIVIYNESVSGWWTDNLDSSIDSIIAKYPQLPRDGSVVCLIHIGGNNVTSIKPYNAVQNNSTVLNMQADISRITTAINRRGWDWIQADLTFRNYLVNSAYSYQVETNGADPYNTVVSKKINKACKSKYTHADGRSWADFYTIIYNNYNTALQSDGIHLLSSFEPTMRNFVVSNVIVPLITKVPPTPLVKQRQRFVPYDIIGLSFGGVAKTYTTGELVFKTNDAVLDECPASGTVLVADAKRRDGLKENTGISVILDATFAGSVANQLTYTLPPYFVAQATGRQAWWIGTKNGTQYENGSIRFTNLPPGTYRLVVTGITPSAATDENRTTIVDIIKGTSASTTLQYEARLKSVGTALPNASFTAVTPVDNEIAITIRRENPSLANTTDAAYLSGIYLSRTA